MTNPLQQFVAERREAKLSKAKPDDIEKIQSDYRFDNWVQTAADRAGQINVASHVGTITHPDAKIAPFVAETTASIDGYLRSGNINASLDAFGNAAALDTLAFVKVQLADQRTVLEHFREGTELVRKCFDFADDELYESIRLRFLQMLANSKPYPVTCGELKQVYFPIGDDQYHLLSLVSSSGMMRDNRLRLQEMRWGDAAKAAREIEKEDIKAKTNQKTAKQDTADQDDVPADASYRTMPGLASIKLGGANAQNISSLNAECKGVWELMPSVPVIRRDYQRLPKVDYFKRSLRWDQYAKFIFAKLDRIFRKPEPGNYDLRQERKDRIEELWLWASSFAFELQSLGGGWSDHESNRLPKHQKRWLDAKFSDEMTADRSWRQEVAADFARWTLTSYRDMDWGTNQSVPLGPIEQNEFKNEVAEMPFNKQEWQTWDR